MLIFELLSIIKMNTKMMSGNEFVFRKYKMLIDFNSLSFLLLYCLFITKGEVKTKISA